MATHRIPASTSSETLGVASRVITGCDVVEALDTGGIDDGIQEAQGSLAVGQTVVIQQSDNSREGLCWNAKSVS